jgi:predicted TIM-barrel fold metal-dependent hydrolase
MTTIDADAHVCETPHTWSYMEEHEQDLRPQIFVRSPEDDGAPRRSNQKAEYWMLEERLISKTNVGKDVPPESRDMIDISSRLAHMDEIGVDIQVLFPSFFLRPITKEPDTDFALARSYNRWLADIWSQAPDRLPWVCVPPLLSLVDIGKVRDELVFAKENGACGIFMRGLECERVLSDRYFFPLYEIAQEQGLAICLHAGNNSYAVHDTLAGDALSVFKFPVMGAFNTLLEKEVPRRFPDVRWAFVETSAQWVPYLLGEVKIRVTRQGRPMYKDPLGENNFYITTQKTDDLAWLLSEIGDDHIIIGTDYGHKDTATEIEALKRMQTDGDLPKASVKKILEDNPARLYAL